MRPLLDTNVLLDLALTRTGLHEASSMSVSWCKNHPGSGVLTAHSLATLSYLLGRGSRPAVVRAFIADLVAGFDIAPIGNPEIARALDLPTADFEDALIVAAGESAGVSHVVTRNIADFRRSPLKAITPEEFVRSCRDND